MSLLKQVVIGMVAVLGAVSSGIALGFSAISMQQLQDDKRHDKLDSDQASWFASLPSVITPVGCFVCGALLDRLGRRPVLMVLNVPFFAGWLLLALTPEPASSHTAQLYAGRLLTGLATGLASVPATIYLGETSLPKLRSTFVTWTSLSISLGIMVVYALGASMPNEGWRGVSAVCVALPVISVVLTWFLVPESPSWLAMKGRNPEPALRKLRGIGNKETLPSDVQQELDKLRQAMKVVNTGIENTQSDMNANVTRITSSPLDSEAQASDCKTVDASLEKDSKSHVISTSSDNLINTKKEIGVYNQLKVIGQLIKEPSVWKPLFVLNGYFFFMHFSGIYVVVYYAVDIVTDAGVKIDPYIATVILGAVQFVSSLVVSFVVTRCGRRPLSVASGIGLTLCMVTLAIYLELADLRNIGKSALSTVPLVAMIVYVISGALGFHTLPWAMLGELYPARVRGFAGGVTTCLAYLFSFAVLKMYPALVEALKNLRSDGIETTRNVFIFFAVTSVVGTAFVAIFLPETRGKTLLEIEAEFNKKKLKDRKG